MNSILAPKFSSKISEEPSCKIASSKNFKYISEYQFLETTGEISGSEIDVQIMTSFLRSLHLGSDEGRSRSVRPVQSLSFDRR